MSFSRVFFLSLVGVSNCFRSWAIKFLRSYRNEDSGGGSLHDIIIKLSCLISPPLLTLHRSLCYDFEFPFRTQSFAFFSHRQNNTKVWHHTTRLSLPPRKHFLAESLWLLEITCYHRRFAGRSFRNRCWELNEVQSDFLYEYLQFR